MIGTTHMSVLLSNTPIAVKNDLFINAYQEGYLRFKTQFEGHMLSDIGIYHFIAQNIYYLKHHDIENAGYITGWFAGLFETVGRPQIEAALNAASQ